MDTKKHMIIANGKNITSNVQWCEYNRTTRKYDILFINGKKYEYNWDNVTWLRTPESKNPNHFKISYKEKNLYDIEAIFVFKNEYLSYWHICFHNGCERDYLEKDLNISTSCLEQAHAKNVFDYLKQISYLSDLKNEQGKKLLANQYEKLDFVSTSTALAKYLSPAKIKKATSNDITTIFPFGCNSSQYKAVKNALENQLSVIQGPPGTGKTQTILNIIANILISGKTVQIVSNNNSATENIIEKLSSPKYNMGFIVAPLGNSENKFNFIQEQTGKYPDIASWENKEVDNKAFLKAVSEKFKELGVIFSKQERLAVAKQEISALELEFKYFNQYMSVTNISSKGVSIRDKIKSSQLMKLWQECQDKANKEEELNILFKMKSIILFGVSNWSFYKNDISHIIVVLQELFYKKKISELKSEISILEKDLESISSQELMNEASTLSMKYLKNELYKRYGNKENRDYFLEEAFWKDASSLLKEYPIVLSTTFSSRSSLGKDTIYDYLIMDEASQVDVATGALALSCAKNIVIVGDTKQLPNVIPEDIKKRSEYIFNSFQIHEGYDYGKNSFLKSICTIMPGIPQTLLCEHYRCHPKIINFCNQKFYNGELVIMTADNDEKNVISVIKTVVGNHERNHYNQRQIDVVKQEVLPTLSFETKDIGIIAPYNNQVDAMAKEIQNIDIATVHKFQGREKEAIILTTVDDEISEFVDDPFLLNVAVSRAKNKLCLVVSGNEQPQNSNISDLIEYIHYNNYEVKESKIYSVFDYLYQQYTQSRFHYLKMHKRISEYDSENLMYTIIKGVLREFSDMSLDIICHQPLRHLIREPNLLSDAEYKYAMHIATHLDFLIYNRISKKSILAIEVDGYAYHQQGTAQAKRDKMKNHILETYNIQYIRFATNESFEKERLRNKLKEILGGHEYTN